MGKKVILILLMIISSVISSRAQRLLETKESAYFNEDENKLDPSDINKYFRNGSTVTELRINYNHERGRRDTTSKTISVFLDKNEKYPLSEIKLNYNLEKNRFDSASKYIYKYNSKQERTFVEEFKYDNATGKWAPSEKAEEEKVDPLKLYWNYFNWDNDKKTYIKTRRNVIINNKAGKTTSVTIENLYGKKWEPDYRDTYEYKNDTVKQSWKEEMWVENSWNNSSIEYYFYDNRNNVIRTVKINAQGDTIQQSLNTYNEKNDIIQEEFLDEIIYIVSQHIWTYNTYNITEEINGYSALKVLEILGDVYGKKNQLKPSSKTVNQYKVILLPGSKETQTQRLNK